MKKILFILGAVGFLAAGCSGTSTTSMNTAPADQQQAQVTPTDTAAQPTPTPAQQPSAEMQAQANANVKVSGADDAVNVVLKNSSDEQTKATAGDDSDLTSSDSASLSSVTEVSNGY